jgi:Nif-specific regulatory protein
VPHPEPELDAASLKTLYRVARALLREQDCGRLLASLLDAAIEAVGAERGFIVVPDGRGFRANVARNFKAESLAQTEEAISTTIARDVLGHGRALLIGDAQETPFREQRSVQRLRLRSVLCAPVLAGEDVVALLYLENRGMADSFTEMHRLLVDEICGLAGPRLQAAIVLEEARRRQQEFGAIVEGEDGIITADPAMVAVLKTARQVADSDLPVLIEGETGTGKELVARAVYRHSRRSKSPFVVLNCAAIPATLIGSELFGHTRGAFTGAVNDRVGFVGAAHRGTLFLDEIGELPLELQPQLLRVLQSGEFTRLGSVAPEFADVRFVAATNRDLHREVEEGRFRRDLYYRLASVTLTLPPLRERPQDVYLLAPHFLRRYAVRLGRQAPQLDDSALAALAACRFPGNVRELEAEIARLVAVTPPGGAITTKDLSPRLTVGAGEPPKSEHVAPTSLAEMEKRLIASVLAHTSGNRTRAAEVLGISREGLRTKMQRLGLEDRE